jgi:Holliday junction resolvase RusA-like endonuclease
VFEDVELRGKQHSPIGTNKKTGKRSIFPDKKQIARKEALRSQLDQIGTWPVPPAGVPVAISAHLLYPFPKSWSQRKTAEMRARFEAGEDLPKTTRPDLDNMVKELIDAITSDKRWTSPILADDNVVWSLDVCKVFHDRSTCDALVILKWGDK